MDEFDLSMRLAKKATSKGLDDCCALAEFTMLSSGGTWYIVKHGDGYMVSPFIDNAVRRYSLDPRGKMLVEEM